MPADDIDAEALARELGAGAAEPPKPATPSETPKGDETPDDKDAKPPEDELKDGEKPADGETPLDPLEEFTKDPDKALQGLLKHPKLGPMLNRWADKTAEAQVSAAKREPRGPTEAEIRDKLQIEKEDKFFEGLSEEQLAEELKDKSAAAAYGRFQLRKEQAAKVPTPEDKDFQVQLAATKSLVVTYKSMVDDSELSDEVKAELQPENYTKHGEDAMVIWGKAIYDAHVAHGVAQAVESAVEEELAKKDKERPSSGGGRPPGSVSDLMTTPSEVGLTQALAAEEEARQRGKK